MKDETQSPDAEVQTLSDVLGSPEQIAGQRIKEFRMARGWSQRELANRMKAAGYPWIQTTVAKTEAADRPLRLNEIANLAAVLGVTANDLMTIPADDYEHAALVSQLSDLRVRAGGAQRRVKECEQARDQAERELRQARAEAQEIYRKLSVLEEEERLLLRDREETAGGE